MKIDVHVHYYTQELNERMQRYTSDKQGWFQYRIDTPLAQRLEVMAATGIDLQALSPGANQPYMVSADEAVDAARFINDYYKNVVEQSAGHSAAFGCVPLPHVDQAIAEAARCLDELEYVGINLGCSVLGRPLDDPAFEPFWTELDRRRTVVALHPLGTGMPMSQEYGITWSVCGCFEDTITALRLVQSGLTARHPNVTVIVPHLGGTIPFLWRRLGNIRGENMDPPTEGLRRLYYDTVNDTPAALRITCEAVGADHVMFGTDAPHPPGVQRCAAYVAETALPAADYDAIMGGNAQRLLNLGVPA